MCIAIYKPADRDISYEVLQRSYNANPDGCGLAYLTEDGIDIYTTMHFDVFWETYQDAIEQYPDSPFLIHFRIATHGSVDEDNCHPFYIESHEDAYQRVFMHNGTITPMAAKCHKSKGISDTVLFGIDILEHLPTGWDSNHAIKQLIEHYIGWSKLVVMDEFGEVTIYNEDKGVWAQGIWYSNRTFEEVKRLPVAKATHPWHSKCDFCNIWVDNCFNYIDEFNTPLHLCYNCKVDFTKAGLALTRVEDFYKGAI